MLFRSNINKMISPEIDAQCTIIVDASIPGHSCIERLDSRNILDIQDICYNWDLEENPKLIPEDPTMGVWNQEPHKDDEYISALYQEYHKHPTIQ